MRSRLLLTALVALSLSACSTTEEDANIDAMDMGNAPVAQGTLDGDQYGDGMASAGVGGVDGAALGTNAQDFVVNAGDRVFFAYDSFDLTPEARSTLDRQAQWLNQNSGLNITVEGHADERGTREYNLALGERRANSVQNYLVAQGVSASRINTISYGKERPAVVGDGPGSWAQNRRSVTVVQ